MTRLLYLPLIFDIPGIDPLLIRTSDGWYAFDGKTLTALLSLSSDTVGALASFDRVGPLVLTQSGQGVFALDHSLTARQVTQFPVARPYVSTVDIAYLDAANLFVVVNSGSADVYVSADFEHFDRVVSPSLTKGLVAPLPDRPALLLVGTDGLYAFEAECPASGE